MIVLSGTIGAGKTSLTTLLSKHLNTPAYYESVDDNPILPLFYKDPKKYAFLLQIYFLNKRLDNIKKSFSNDKSVLDRSIYEDALMFKLNADLGRATQTESETYDSLLNNMMQELPDEPHKKNPDLLIYINISFNTMLKRIKKRGRPYEQVENDSSLYEYYKDLDSRYRTWFDNYNHSPKLEIDGDKFDFIVNNDDRKEVLQLIDQKINQVFK